MKILVPVKRVIDHGVKLRVKTDGAGVDLANVTMLMNPFDEIAIEEAICLKEKGVATENVVVSVGISGAIQHFAGMKGSKAVVALNKDEDARNIKVADLSLVGDLFEVLPVRNEKIRCSLSSCDSYPTYLTLCQKN